MAQLGRQQASGARTGQRHHHPHCRRHRRIAPVLQPPYRSDRRPVDGRHEHRRRPVRRRQDVPAAGGEVRPGDEAGRGPPDPVHRTGKRRQAGGQGQDPDGDRQRRRARHRQEHRRRGAGLQRLRHRRPGRDGAGGENPAGGQGTEVRHHRPVRPDHPVAGRDGPRRPRNAAPGLPPAADDRWRDHFQGAHGSENRAQVQQ
ncbi:hypothetical protein D9M73_168880 [compost metagenome]